jgi:hypothetical protein
LVVSKQLRVYLTVDAQTKALLEEWANQQGRNVTNLASWIVEREMRRAVASGEFKSTQTSEDSLELLRSFFDAVAAGRFYSDSDLARLATEVEIDVNHLIAHQNCFKKKGKAKGGN